MIVSNKKIEGIQEGKATKKIDYRHTTRQKEGKEEGKKKEGLKATNKGRIARKKGRKQGKKEAKRKRFLLGKRKAKSKKSFDE